MNLIVETEMPKRCTKCGVRLSCMRYVYGLRRNAAENLKPLMGDKDCLIKGVLPDEHGDLIDRDAFIHKYLAFYTEQERKKNLVFAAVEVKQQFADMICDERALIAAERKDDGDKISV